MRPDPLPADMRVTSRLVVGLLVMAAGLVLALDSLGLVDARFLFRFWPLVLVAIGVVKWSSSQGSAGLVWIVAGLGFLLVSFGRMGVPGVWALVLFFAGAHITLRALRPSVPRGPATTDAAFDMVAFLGGAKSGRVSSSTPDGASQPFKGGRAMAVMGGCEVDLRRATLPEGGEAVVDVFVMWGGIEIKVPEDWEVVNHGNAFLGGIINNTRPLPGANRRLIVTGTAMMGGVDIKN